MSKRAEADRIVRNHILWAMGGGLVPFPLLDIAAVTAIQVDMLKQLADIYEADFAKSEGKTYVTALGSSSLARLGASAIKLIPGVGTMIGGMSMSALSGASTYAVGQVSIRHFEGNGSMLNVDMDWAKKAYDKAFKKGKTVVKTMKKESEDAQDVVASLDQLKKMYDKDLISEAEYEAKKEELLDQL